MSSRGPTEVYHFTRVEHLPTILGRGLVSDTRAREEHVLTHEIGNVGIKGRRAIRPVPVYPGGVVADYVPFYFAPRSPMMFAIDRGNVPTYTDGCDRLIYLVSSLDKLADANRDVVLTDRNAVLGVADFHSLRDGEPEEGFIDWELMAATYWNNTSSEPDRRERRMAECLVMDEVPVDAITAIATKSNEVLSEVREVLAACGVGLPAGVRRPWYF